MINNIFFSFLNKIVLNFTSFIIKTLNIKIDLRYKTKKFYKLGISNHVSELDVMLLFLIFSKANFNYSWISDERFEHYPVIGKWAKHNKTIFVSRTDGTGCESLRSNVSSNSNVFIFPEGTLYYRPMIKKSNSICKKLKINKYKNVLCPKVNGFNTLVEILEPQYITNITLDYVYGEKNNNHLMKSNVPLTIYNLFKNPPTKIVIIIDRIKVNNKTDINNIFRDKDLLLNKKFDKCKKIDLNK